MEKLGKYKFTLWGMRPNNFKKGALFLIFLGIYNAGVYLFIPRLESLIIGILFTLFGVGAYKGLNIFLYIGTFLWLIGVLGSVIDIVGNVADIGSSTKTWMPGALFLQILFIWSLIKSLPVYHKIYEKKTKKMENNNGARS